MHTGCLLKLRKAKQWEAEATLGCQSTQEMRLLAKTELASVFFFWQDLGPRSLKSASLFFGEFRELFVVPTFRVCDRSPTGPVLRSQAPSGPMDVATSGPRAAS